MNIAEFIQKKEEVKATLPEKNREAYQKMVEIFLLKNPHRELYIYPDVGKHQGYVGVGANSKPMHFVEYKLLLKNNEVVAIDSTLHKTEEKVLTLVDPLGREVVFKTYNPPRQIVK
ncbi:MAG: hypothetical protein K0R18_312 [Bacillales bacterium]|jgi:hypothetical protein|nr:hypothetical protein [Bacillales bacterium]